jgi:hypothetical protein
MQHATDYHRINECPSCNDYWKRNGRQAVGLVDYEHEEVCPTCRAS